jgi:hypothetical protein
MRTQKGSILAFIVFVIVFAFSIAMSHAQTKVTASATISKEVKQPEAWKGKTIKLGSSIVPDTTKLRTGSRGGQYYYKLSKNGNVYKCYIAKTVK